MHVNEEALNQKIEDLTEKYDREINDLQDELQGEHNLNKTLLDKIQEYKTNQYIKEENIANSKAMKFL